MTVCQVSGCERFDKLARGWCPTHYSQWYRYGDPEGGRYTGRYARRRPRLLGSTPGVCVMNGCERPYYGNGFCNLHWLRSRRGQDLDVAPRHLREVTTCSGAHQRVYALWGRAADYLCIQCGGPAKDWAYDGTDPNQGYGVIGAQGEWHYQYFSSWPEFYMPMCRRCHGGRDGKLAQAELREFREWKVRHPGVTLADIDGLLVSENAMMP